MKLDFCTNYPILNAISFLLKVFDIICIVVPIIIVIVSTIGIAKAIIEDDNDAVKKVTTGIVKRVIIGVVIFLVPTLTKGFVNLINENTNSNFDLFTCINNTKNLEYYKQLYATEQKKYDDSIQNINEKYKKEQEAREAALRQIKASTGSNIGQAETVYGGKFNLTDSELRFIAGVCQCEQGNPDGVAAEATLIANRYELYGKRYGSLYNYVKNSKWWACARYNTKPSNSSLSRTKSVLVDGMRTMSLKVDEHDCIKCGKSYDITKLVVNGRTITDKKALLDKSNYVRDVTVIYNRYTAVYTFYTFPCKSCDPFGYTQAAANRLKGR